MRACARTYMACLKFFENDNYIVVKIFTKSLQKSPGGSSPAFFFFFRSFDS